jgi:hypothetical protein
MLDTSVSAGVPSEQAEAHADAARTYLMAELVTKSDLDALRRELEGKIDSQTLRLMVRLGAMLAAGIAILAAVQRLS